MRSDFLGIIKFNDTPVHDKAPIVQILRTTKFTHPTYGAIEITPAMLKQFKENFDKKVRRQDIAIDYFHDNEGVAAGWIKELFFSDDENELWARVDWTKNALQKLNEKELRYFSPEFAFKWTDPETGVSYSNVLFGGGLTNRPQVKDMAPITLKEIKGDKKMDEKVKELEAQIVKLQEDAALEGKKMQDDVAGKAAKIAELEKAIEAMKAELERLKGENAGMLEEKNLLVAEKEKMLKETEFNTMLSEGKVCEAQREAFLKGDFAEFAKNAKAVNLSDKGNNSVENENKITDAAAEVLKLAEVKVKEEKIDLGTAVSKVLRENEELRKKYENQ